MDLLEIKLRSSSEPPPFIPEANRPHMGHASPIIDLRKRATSSSPNVLVPSRSNEVARHPKKKNSFGRKQSVLKVRQSNSVEPTWRPSPTRSRSSHAHVPLRRTMSEPTLKSWELVEDFLEELYSCTICGEDMEDELAKYGIKRLPFLKGVRKDDLSDDVTNISSRFIHVSSES